MCNLSQGIEDKAMAKGIEQGIEQGKDIGRAEGAGEKAIEIARNLLKLGTPLEIIAEASKLPANVIQGLATD